MDNLQQQLLDLQQQIEEMKQQPTATTQVCQATEVNKVSVQLPSFWKQNSSLWFAQAEAQFSIANITSESTKYSYVVSKLDEHFAHEVQDILTNTPVHNPYTTLKNELIKRLSLSQGQRIKQILMEEELGDRKPSQFLRHLRSLAGTGPVKDDLLRTIWAQRLPTYVQAILQTQPETISLDNLASIADKVIEVHPISANDVNAISPSYSFDKITSAIQDLQQQIEDLKANITQQNRSHSRDQTQSVKSRSRSPSRSRSLSMCWYHQRYADKAQKCVFPCSYSSTNFPSSQ